ncbi:hypothetical protein O181_077106 [Austropuccinia psidii MF-1]|uniref:Uncharacterized protein n=1 Tax=Austropuccinia psidii MF-1 TaxID=1389203 RepID=A0A9Q3FBP4_9BASI|nr:hypothetical protein [Austropuccinia psidii MF-1]
MPLCSGRFFLSNESDSSDSDSIEEQILPLSNPPVQSAPSTTVPIDTMVSTTPIKKDQPDIFGFDPSSPAFMSFLKNPLKFISHVPKLKSDGSNFAEWIKALANIFNVMLFTNDPDNFESVPQARGALRFFIQQTIASELSEMIQNEVSPKLAFIELQDNFKKSTRLMQLDIVNDLFEMYSLKQVFNSNDCFSKLFTLFEKYRHLGIPLSSKWKGFIVQVFAPIPHGITRASWFNCISSKLDCSNKNDPCDI